MGKDCRFCRIEKGEIGDYGVIDSPFFSGNNYFSIVSIGAFIDGWTMIITRNHKFSLRNEYVKDDFRNYLNEHISILKRKYKNTKKFIIFEHGANSCNSLTACGTSHAHLHVMPFDDSILEEILNDKLWTKCSFSCVEKLVDDKEYLLYGEGDSSDMEVYVHIVNEPESQYFRRILAKKVGLNGEYDYKADARQGEAIRIRKKLEDN